MKSFRPQRWMILWGALIIPAAYGQSAPRIQANVPFDFHVDGREFPAGQYTVTAGPGASYLILQGADVKKAQFLLTMPVYNRTPIVQPRLVFNRYDNDYFLSTIWLGGSAAGKQLTPGHKETELARRLSSPARETALSAIQPAKL